MGRNADRPQLRAAHILPNSLREHSRSDGQAPNNELAKDAAGRAADARMMAWIRTKPRQLISFRGQPSVSKDRRRGGVERERVAFGQFPSWPECEAGAIGYSVLKCGIVSCRRPTAGQHLRTLRQLKRE